MSSRLSSEPMAELDVGGRGFRLPQTVVAVVLHQALDHVLWQQQPLTAAAGAPFGQLLAHLIEGQRLVRIGQKDAEDRLERRHIPMDVVLGTSAVLADALQWIASVRRAMNLEAHAAGRLV